jgi:hypothetical protein
MQRYIAQQFARGDLNPRSEMIELKHIGPYLHERLRRSFARNTSTLTIRRFASSIQNMSVTNLKRRLQTALQNARNNQCIGTGGRIHHVQDFNEKGFEVLISLIKVLANNRDGHNLGRNFQFDASALRMPPRRDDDAKIAGCLSRGRCRSRGYRWRNGLCVPNANSTGFSGVYPTSGQKTRPRNQNYELGTIRNSVKRGRYTQADENGVEWRRPGFMRKLR